MNRAEVYEAVWAAPMAQAAAALGVGERALAKAYRKAGIPTPPRGHWRKVAAGLAGERPPLGEAPPSMERVRFPQEGAQRNTAMASQPQPWPADLLQRRSPDLPPSTAAVSETSQTPRTIEAAIDEIASAYQHSLSRRALLLEVIATIERAGSSHTPAMRRALALLGADLPSQVVETAVVVIATCTDASA